MKRFYPDASIILGTTPGSPKGQFETGARGLGGDRRRLIITHVGISKIMGALFRTLCAVPSATVTLVKDTSWVEARAKKLLRRWHFSLLTSASTPLTLSSRVILAPKCSRRDAAVLPEDERQIMVFMARFSFMPRLNCVSRNLSSSISTDPLRMVDALQLRR